MKNPVKERICIAYIELLTELNHADITITDITNKCGVSRTSFYRNFSTFGDLINGVGDLVYERMVKDLVPNFLFDRSKAWKDFADKALTGVKEGTSIIANLQPTNLPFLVSQIEKRIDFSHLNTLPLKQKYDPMVNVSIIFASAIAWAKNNFEDPQEELLNYIVDKIL